jgi:hypothetical protein
MRKHRSRDTDSVNDNLKTGCQHHFNANVLLLIHLRSLKQNDRTQLKRGHILHYLGDAFDSVASDRISFHFLHALRAFFFLMIYVCCIFFKEIESFCAREEGLEDKFARLAFFQLTCSSFWAA